MTTIGYNDLKEGRKFKVEVEIEILTTPEDDEDTTEIYIHTLGLYTFIDSDNLLELLDPDRAKKRIKKEIVALKKKLDSLEGG